MNAVCKRAQSLTAHAERRQYISLRRDFAGNFSSGYPVRFSGFHLMGVVRVVVKLSPSLIEDGPVGSKEAWRK